MDRFIQSLKSSQVHLYIGYTLGENRSVNNDKTKTHSYPLRDIFHMTEERCKEYLIAQEMENPLYRHFNRTGCAMCPYQSDQSFYALWKSYPKVWNYMRDVESKLNGSLNDRWFTNYRTCEDMEKLFKQKDKQGSLFDFSDEPLKDCFCKI